MNKQKSKKSSKSLKGHLGITRSKTMIPPKILYCVKTEDGRFLANLTFFFDKALYLIKSKYRPLFFGKQTIKRRYNKFRLGSFLFKRLKNFKNSFVLRSDPVENSYNAYQFYKNIFYRDNVYENVFGRNSFCFYPMSLWLPLRSYDNIVEKRLVDIYKAWKTRPQKKLIGGRTFKKKYYKISYNIREDLNDYPRIALRGFWDVDYLIAPRLIMNAHNNGYKAYLNYIIIGRKEFSNKHSKRLLLNCSAIKKKVNDCSKLIVATRLNIARFLIRRKFFFILPLICFHFEPLLKVLIFSYFYLIKLNWALMHTYKNFWFAVANIDFCPEKEQLVKKLAYGAFFYSCDNFANFIKQLLSQNTLILSSNKNEGFSDVFVYKFLRRVLHLLTKRGGKHRAFWNLDLVLYSVYKSSFQKLNGKLRDISPILEVIFKLRTYFFLRKVTKGRRTFLIPGILPKKKRIKVIARWFISSLKPRTGTRLADSLLEELWENYKGVGSAQKMQQSFNKLVSASKVNIIVRRRRRRRRFFSKKKAFISNNNNEENIPKT